MNRVVRAKARAVVARMGKLEDASAAEQGRILRALRRDVLAALGRAPNPTRAAQLRRLLNDVDRLAREARQVSVRAVAPRVRAAADLGARLSAATADANMAGISAPVVRALVATTTEQLTDVWAELGSKLKREIRRTVAGVADPYEAQQALAKMLRRDSTYARAAARAETITRTETNRTFSRASHDAAESGGRVVKWWLTAGDGRVRDAHVEAGRRYTESRAIPQEEPFIVDGEELMYPLDPNGSAENTINCRCVALYVVRS